MKTETVVVTNMKCMGCVNSVKMGLTNLGGVTDIVVDLPSSTVTFTYDGSSEKRAEISSKLQILGYPEVK
ncbi:MAG: heavy-metal-associated domain-containing protein [Bacteroidales bacterium]|nr:heavy-metal-associated domain-containing protein [Bacteroidales bacterium]MBN2748737.1 heavy-metal-associated domain-containing protein [Bacteroidales bacterium]